MDCFSPTWSQSGALMTPLFRPKTLKQFVVFPSRAMPMTCAANTFTTTPSKLEEDLAVGKPTQTRMKPRSMLMAMTIVGPRTCYLVLMCAFVFIGEAAVGRKVDDQPTTKSGRKRKRARVLGSNTNALKRLKILNGVHGKNNTSLKSNQYNKMYLKSQGEVYDTENPSILVIPLLPLEQVMDWAMEGHQEPYDILTLTFGPRSRRAAKILETAPQECSDNEVEEARQLLETFVKGVTGSLVENDVFESFRKTELNNTSNLSLIRWKELVQRIKDGSQEMIKVPSRKNPLPANFRVAKARLSKGNSLPDPWLLTLKAAINYSAFNKTKLMPACQPWTEDDGPPNTDQGQQDYSKDSIDHAAQLALTKQRGRSCIELFYWDKQ